MKPDEFDSIVNKLIFFAGMMSFNTIFLFINIYNKSLEFGFLALFMIIGSIIPVFYVGYYRVAIIQAFSEAFSEKEKLKNDL